MSLSEPRSGASGKWPPQPGRAGRRPAQSVLELRREQVRLGGDAVDTFLEVGMALDVSGRRSRRSAAQAALDSIKDRARRPQRPAGGRPDRLL